MNCCCFVRVIGKFREQISKLSINFPLRKIYFQLFNEISGHNRRFLQYTTGVLSLKL